MTSSYQHEEELHNLDACTELVGILYDLLRPVSVVDVGCGTGNFLKAFKNLGVQRVLGYDGSWVDPDRRRQFITDEEFRSVDLESLDDQPADTGDAPFDLAISLEVGEHLKAEAASGLVQFLTMKSDTIVFSAAIPHHGGQNHVHCQWPEYWGAQFRERGFVTFDPLRMAIWNNSAIAWWYQQNIFVACRSGTDRCQRLTHQVPELPSLVHPRLLECHVELLETIYTGKYPLVGYASMLKKKLKSLIGL